MLRRFWNVSANGPVLPLSVPPTTGQSLQVCKAEGRKNESFSRLKTAEWSVHLPPSGMTSFLPAVLVLLGRKHSVDWGGSSGALCFAASVQGQPHLWEATTHLEKSAQCWITAPKSTESPNTPGLVSTLLWTAQQRVPNRQPPGSSSLCVPPTTTTITFIHPENGDSQALL
jgi:hypothetical protein